MYNEMTAENAALEQLRQLGYELIHGPDIAPGGPTPEREDWGQTILTGRLRAAVARLNPEATPEQHAEAVKRFLRTENQDLILENMRRYELLIHGVPVSYSEGGHQPTTQAHRFPPRRGQRLGSGEPVHRDRAPRSPARRRDLSQRHPRRLATDKDNEHVHLAMLWKLLNDEVRTVRRRNLVKGRKFSEILDAAVNKYTNQALSAAEVIAELVKVAKEMKSEQQRAAALNLSVGELAFFDALGQNEAAVMEMGDEKLRNITVDLVQSVQNSVTIDWHNRESVKAGMRSRLRRLLARHRYPPDHQETAVDLVLDQAQLSATTQGGL